MARRLGALVGLMLAVLAPEANAEILLPPGFTVQVYVTGDGFDTAEGRDSRARAAGGRSRRRRRQRLRRRPRAGPCRQVRSAGQDPRCEPREGAAAAGARARRRRGAVDRRRWLRRGAVGAGPWRN